MKKIYFFLQIEKKQQKTFFVNWKFFFFICQNIFYRYDRKWKKKLYISQKKQIFFSNLKKCKKKKKFCKLGKKVKKTKCFFSKFDKKCKNVFCKSSLFVIFCWTNDFRLLRNPTSLASLILGSPSYVCPSKILS